MAGKILWGHYGAIRGLNHMRDADLLVTMGDPRPNITATQNDLALLGLEDEVGSRRVDLLARAELEQAHGRLRAPRRTKAARALHVGSLRPSGTGWAGEVEVRRIGGGRPRNLEAMTALKLRQIIDEMGGMSRAARTLGISRSTLKNYTRGRTAPPVTLLTQIEIALHGSADTTRESLLTNVVQKP